MTDPIDQFHPAVAGWFREAFAAPTEAQVGGWPEIAAGRDTLIAAPTGSGKTLAAFLAGIDALARRAEAGDLPPAETAILYISPLKALGTDIHRNLDIPLAGIREHAEAQGRPLPEIRTAVRSGDTPPSARQAQVRKPPHILITTPESLYLLLTSEKGRRTLRHVRTVIVDEIHSLARDRRGVHLALSLERLTYVVEAAGGRRPQRIALSATQRPIEEIGAFLVGSDRVDGAGVPDCSIVDRGHRREMDLAVEVPGSELEAIASREQWGEIYDLIADRILEHRTTLVFVNTRRMAERTAHELSRRLQERQTEGFDGVVAAHHGSLSKDRRLTLERRLKAGDLRALVATASLELGIDIGSIDLVCQVASPGSVATFLQRVGRAGHALDAQSKGRIFPSTRDELVECAALVRAVDRGVLDRIVQPVAPLDVLAQQIVAECAAEDWAEADLYTLFRRAWPYRDLTREAYAEAVSIVADGVGEGAGRTTPLLHHDRIKGMLRGRRGARLTALTNGGTIPDLGNYRVIAEPDDSVVGEVDEDFAIESRPGDIFLLGSTSWRIKRVETNSVRVQNAHGAPPTIPFWFGEAPGRSPELSAEVGDLRADVAAGLIDEAATVGWLRAECGLDRLGAEQLVHYIRATQEGLGIVPTHRDVVFERFFDEAGGMQLVVHAPFGSRINRPFGLALRKRFCVQFDFELQAAASDDGVLLSLGPQHSFPLDDAFHYVRTGNVLESVEQSILYIPLFATRFRWAATRALAIPRQRGGRRIPPFVQRMRADDLVAAVFPQQVGCQENVTGPLEIPDHPLVRQAVDDCLREAMNIDALLGVLGEVEAGEIRLHARDTVEPSVMAHEIINGKPFTFLDDAPLEERRTRAVSLRRGLPERTDDLGELDPDAIERVRGEAWPAPRNAEEVHDALLGMVVVAEADVPDWLPSLSLLAAEGRAAAFLPPPLPPADEAVTIEAAAVDEPRSAVLWMAAEHVEAVRAIYGTAGELVFDPPLDVPASAVLPVEDREEARRTMLRGQSEVLGPFTAAEGGRRLGLRTTDVERGLVQVEAFGFILRGHFTPESRADDGIEEWCDRRLLARVHRYTLDRLRRDIDPVPPRDLMRFLLRWHHLLPGGQLEGRGGVRQAVQLLAGFEAPARAWEEELLRARVTDYGPGWLDELCLAGEVTWARLTPKRASGRGGQAATRVTPIALLPRGDLPVLLAAARFTQPEAAEALTGAAGEIEALLADRGALFFDQVVTETRRLASDAEEGLRVLLAAGRVHADGFQGLRQLAGLGAHRGGSGRGSRRRRSYLARGMFAGGGPAGRWEALRSPDLEAGSLDDLAEHLAMLLLHRYGVLFRDLMTRESLTVPWRELLRALRRMEARGVVRGGRFVSGFAGEQYALPEAVEALRRVRHEPITGQRVTVSAVDPLNLVGIVLPGERVPAVAGRTVTYVDGMPAELVGVIATADHAGDAAADRGDSPDAPDADAPDARAPDG